MVSGKRRDGKLQQYPHAERDVHPHRRKRADNAAMDYIEPTVFGFECAVDGDDQPGPDYGKCRGQSDHLLWRYNWGTGR